MCERTAWTVLRQPCELLNKVASNHGYTDRETNNETVWTLFSECYIISSREKRIGLECRGRFKRGLFYAAGKCWMKCLEYPFDGQYLLKKKKSIKRELLAENVKRTVKKIAVLGGSTTSEIVAMLELFLLQEGIQPVFYEGEYGRYYEEAVFPNPGLTDFAPDLIIIHTSNRNILDYPELSDAWEKVQERLDTLVSHFSSMWDSLARTYGCPVIQNNMELPLYRLLGNQDGVFCQGRTSFIRRINREFAAYAAEHRDFYIHDLEYVASDYGLRSFSDPFYWHMYKYCMCLPAVPAFAYSLANMVKSIFGRNKKGLVLDLDNTLWGGIVGEEGAAGIELGQETSMGQVYSEFQAYLKQLKEIGVVLAVDSKNDMENALAGLNAPGSVLTEEDFLIIKANWESKDINFREIAASLSLLPESLVFVDDNPAEREIITGQLPGVPAPPLQKPEEYAIVLDRAGYFEVTSLSEDDRRRNEMYRENLQRVQAKASFASYEEYLRHLEMRARIEPFEAVYISRIAQLTNKSNQFNLTTRRYTAADLETMMLSEDYITLYGQLEDRFGDNGIVSVIIGHRENATRLHLDLWLMSCRVLKRDMECAMMDELVRRCKMHQIDTIYGYYYRTAKNNMVRYFYRERGFTLLEEQENGDSLWRFEIPQNYEEQNRVIQTERQKGRTGAE